MTRAARPIQTAEVPPSRRRRRAPSPTRSPQLAIAFDGEPARDHGLPARRLVQPMSGHAAPSDRAPREARAAVAALAAASAGASPRSSDWSGFREGAREVLVTLMATLAIGLAWAAIEAGGLSAELASPVAASDGESR